MGYCGFEQEDEIVQPSMLLYFEIHVCVYMGGNNLLLLHVLLMT